MRLNNKKSFKIFIEKGMVNDDWALSLFGIVSVFGPKYGFKIV